MLSRGLSFKLLVDNSDEIKFVRPLIDEVFEIVRADGEQFGVPICRAQVSRFVSREVSGYEEMVITFFSDAERSKIVDFFPRLADSVGAWRERQAGTASEAFVDQLAVEIDPSDRKRSLGNYRHCHSPPTVRK